MPTWLITGCSTGLGRALATAVLERGDNAVVTARDAARVEDLAERFPSTALALALDVTDHARVRAVVAAAAERFGSIDVLVNNAGYGYRAAVEEGDDDDLQRLFATNVFGAVAAVKAVLPGMREQRSGTIVNISSIGARITPAGSGYYSATKAALEGPHGLPAQGAQAAGHPRDDRRARGIPYRLLRPVAPAVRVADRRLRRDRRAPSQGARHGARDPGR
jgi:NAD(P)-dependent dehydrogenase (short-subunit alcohol dehydrogenase family)